MKIVWSDRASRQLDAIQAYIARDSKRYAKAMIRRITRKTRLLKRFPYLGSLVAKWEDEGVRELLEPPYRIFYRVTETQVEIIDVYHGARDSPRSLGTDAPR